MIIYAHTITPRLQYIADFIGKEMGSNNSFQLTDSIELYKASKDFKINYSTARMGEDDFFIHPHSILFENDIKPQQINCFAMNGYKVFFKTEGDFGFDIFAASFYLLSRYEEYLPHKKDMYGRYAYENSLAYRESFLQLPLINIWINDFKKAPTQKFKSTSNDNEFTIHHSPLTFLPTYDIDEAYAYRHKTLFRNAGGIIKSVLSGKWKHLNERWQVISGKLKDPYDSYEWMDQLHSKYSLKPYYFFIVAEKKGKYDKNISPVNNTMRQLIRHCYYKYPMGIHPSWQSGDTISLVKKEKQTLEEITGGQIVSSRQHYIRFTLPQTFRYLIDAGIEFDFSMGYGSINGFRASAASPFYWYDLEKEKVTSLLLYPFCFMDANSFFEQKFTAQQAYVEMKHYYDVVKSVNGIMISIWHNNFLGTSEIYNGWKEAYEKFISEINFQTPSGSGKAGEGV